MSSILYVKGVCLFDYKCTFPGLHDDVIKWKYFPRYWPFVRGIHRSRVNSPHKGQWRGALIFCLICAWTNGWVNTRDAGDLRYHRAHYDVNVMILCRSFIITGYIYHDHRDACWEHCAIFSLLLENYLSTLSLECQKLPIGLGINGMLIYTLYARRPICWQFLAILPCHSVLWYINFNSSTASDAYIRQ